MWGSIGGVPLPSAAPFDVRLAVRSGPHTVGGGMPPVQGQSQSQNAQMSPLQAMMLAQLLQSAFKGSGTGTDAFRTLGQGYAPGGQAAMSGAMGSGSSMIPFLP